MLPWIGAPRLAWSVDRAGTVRCPSGDRDLDVARCRSCPYLDELVVDGDGNVCEVVCAPAFGSLAASPLAAPRWRTVTRSSPVA